MRTCHLPPATFQSAALPLEPTKCLNLLRGFSIFLTQHGSRQTSSGVSSILEASYNSNSRGFVDSIITHSQYHTAALSTFPSSTQKTKQLSDLVPILPSVSATLLGGSCLPSYVLLHASFE